MDSSTSQAGVPDNPADAQRQLYFLLGRAVARCQIAEAAANTVHQIFVGMPAPRRRTLGQTVHSLESHLPPELMTEYLALVDARNYLVHELLSDHGGWKGVPGWDSRDLYRKLYGSIAEATAKIDNVTDRLNEYIVSARPDVAIFTLGDDGVRRVEQASQD